MNRIFNTIFRQRGEQNRFLLFSCVLFLSISAVAFVVYISAVRQINRTYIQQQLIMAGETVKLRLATEVSSELAFVVKLASSPIIQEYFASPNDPELQQLAHAEFRASEQHIREGLIFWVNDIDKIFYSTGAEPFTIDPGLPENYWYNLTLYDTEEYNFNINYNPDLEMIYLWVNIPVFALGENNTEKPLGMLGTALNLTNITQLVETAHRDRSRYTEVFLFNEFNEITSAADFGLIVDKVHLGEHLGAAGYEAIRVINTIDDGRGRNYNYDGYIYRAGIVPVLNWYIAIRYPLPGLLAQDQSLNVVFFVMLSLVFILFVIMNLLSARSNRAMAEQKYLSSRIEAIISNLPGMVFQCINTYPDYPLTFASEGSRDLLGYTPEQLVGGVNMYMQMLHPDDVEAIEQRIAGTLDRGLVYESAHRLIMHDGTVKWVWERSCLLERNPDGSPPVLEGYVLDITEQKQLEADRAARLEEAANEALEASRAKSEFLAKMSHEIRTPMNAIIGIAQIQIRKGDLPHEYRLALAKIYNSGNNLLRIINDILDMSKIETGKMELNPAEYDIPSLIHDAVQLNTIRIGSKPVEFILSIDENLPSKLIGDEIRIKQILNNLLSNAIKYTENGYVKLSVSHTDGSGGVKLRFAVEDTGQGMKPENTERLFSEYSRFNTGANRAIEGTGIGLNITKNLAEMMGGTIEVESVYGKGSTFTVTVRQKAVECRPIGPQLAAQLSSFTFQDNNQFQDMQISHTPMPYGKVLIVDDVETNLYVAEGLMSPYQLTIETAVSGFAVIDKVSGGQTYDIIFMDHMMPLMDGIEATQKLRDMGYKGVIVALTANALVGNEEMFKEHGFDGFIAKPIDVRQLNAVLNKYVRDRHPEGKQPDGTSNSYVKNSAEQSPGVSPKLLEIFRRDAENAVITLRKSAADGDIKLFTTTAHAMKSALMNIGETAMSEAALALEKAGFAGDAEYINAHAEEFASSLEALANNLRPEDDAAGGSAAEDEAYLIEHLRLLELACEDNDGTAAFASLDRLKEKSWNTETSAALEVIREALSLRNDFEEAAELVISLSDSI